MSHFPALQSGQGLTPQAYFLGRGGGGGGVIFGGRTGTGGFTAVFRNVSGGVQGLFITVDLVHFFGRGGGGGGGMFGGRGGGGG